MLRAVLLIATALTCGTALAQEPAPGCVAGIVSARYDGPTKRYPHGALGDTIEWADLHARVELRPGCSGTATGFSRRLPDNLVFEDVAPRLVDLDRDGLAEIIVVESHQTKGARLAVWGLSGRGFGRIAATPHIGTRFRWLAPVGAADLDGDGHMEVAYVDRPHLAKTLRVWRYANGRLSEVASTGGLSNHRIGDRDISGGIRSCGGRPEMITADSDWKNVVATRLEGGRLHSRTLGPILGPDSLSAHLTCR